jgi:hypothetical protein
MAVDGTQWATLPASSNPIYEGTMIRTGQGTASVLLKDGTQFELQPRTLVGLSGSRTAPVVKIAVGQVLFRVSTSSRATFVTPTVRYQTENGNMMGDRPTALKAKASTLSAADPVGEITVNRQGGSRIGLQQGEMLAKSMSDPGLHIVKAGQSVYLPLVGAPEPGFDVMLAQALPDEAAAGAGSATDTADTAIEEAPIVGTGTGIGAETVVGLVVGLGAIGAGIGLGVNNSGTVSPSTP